MVAGLLGMCIMYIGFMANTRECGLMCNTVVGVIFAAICWLELMTTSDEF